MRNGFTNVDSKISLGLERIERVLDSSGNPQKGFYSVLVGGTNGKGSVAHLLARFMMEKGEGVGLYTSPHLLRVSERVVINGREVPEEVLDRLVRRVGLFSRETGVELTPFEGFTAAAFLAFAEAGVRWVIAEVGMGGRLDATNLLHASLSVITNVALDHSQWLGTSLSQVAREKAGIIKTGRPVVLGELPNGALETVLETASERGAPVHRYGREYFVRVTDFSSQGVKFSYYSDKIPEGVENLRLSSLGEHFAVNASIALRALEVLGEDVGEWVRGVLERFSLPGRGQVVRLSKGVRILDVAHNPAGMEALCRGVASLLRDRPLFLFSLLRDKEWREMGELLCRWFGRESLLFVSLPCEERVLEPSLVESKLGVSTCGEGRLGEILLGHRGTVVVCGCFALVRRALEILREAGVD